MNKQNKGTPSWVGYVVLGIFVVGAMIGIGTYLGIKASNRPTPNKQIQQEHYAVEQEPELIVETPIIETIKPVIPITPVVEIPKPIIVEPELDGTRLDAKNYLDSLESIKLGTGSLSSSSTSTRVSYGGASYSHSTRDDNIKITNIDGKYTQTEDVRFKTMQNDEKSLNPNIVVQTVLPYKVTRALDNYYRNDWESINTVKKKFEKLHTDFGFNQLYTPEMETYFEVSWMENGERVFHNTRNAIINNFYIPWENKGKPINIAEFFWKENIEIDPSIVSVSLKLNSYRGSVYYSINEDNNVTIRANYLIPTIKIDLTKLENPDDVVGPYKVEWKSDNSMNLNLIKSPSV